jgi:hypothetical protein
MANMEAAGNTVDPQGSVESLIALEPYSLDFPGITQRDGFVIPLHQVWAVSCDPFKRFRKAFNPKRIHAGRLYTSNHNVHK